MAMHVSNNGASGLRFYGDALPSGIEKTTGAWSIGSGGGMLDAGTVAANRGYHLFTITDGIGGVDVLASLSANDPVVPSGWAVLERFNCFTTGAGGAIDKGIWYANGDFRLSAAKILLNAAPANYQEIVALPVPVGVKLRVFGLAFGASTAGGNPAFFIVVRDPDLGAIPDDGYTWYESAGYKMAGGNDGYNFDAYTDHGGYLSYVTYPRVSTNNAYIYLQGWTYKPDALAAGTFTFGLLGASDVQNRNCREWPLLLAQALQVGKTRRVERAAFGKDNSVANIADGSAQRLADMRADAVLLSFYKDANGTVSPSASLTNMYAVVDCIRAKRSDTAVFLLKTWRLPAAAEASTFPSLSSYWANYATVQANRSNVSIIDAYTAWGDPALYPSEFGSDQLHPLLPGLQRVTIPTCLASLAPLVV